METDLIDTELTWAWTNPDGLPRGFRMALEDADQEAQSEYRFSSGPIGLRNFRLRAEYEDLAGDVLGDRLVNEEDATQILNHALGLESIADFALELADVSLNGEVTPRQSLRRLVDFAL